MAGAIEAGGGSALVVPGDAAEEGTAPRAAEATLARLGRPDCLVTAQGAGTFGPLEVSRLADWDAMLRANLTATYVLCRAGLPPVLTAGRGTIVAVVSLAAVRAIPGCAVHTASKAGVLGLVRALGAEVRGRGVRVAALCPGAVDTLFWDGITSPPDCSRMFRPEAVAEAALLVVVRRPGRSSRRSSSPRRRGCFDPPTRAGGAPSVGYNANRSP